MYSIELDFALDACEPRATRADILRTITAYGLTYTILTENGPAGGNPLLELRGERDQIEKYLRQSYLNDDKYLNSEVEYLMTFAKQCITFTDFMSRLTRAEHEELAMTKVPNEPRPTLNQMSLQYLRDKGLNMKIKFI